MLPLDALKSMRVMFATPCFASQCASTYTSMIFKLGAKALQLGDAWLELRSESSICHGRNRMVAQFLSEPQWTHLFWIDADVEAEQVERIFRLLLADKDVVAGVYPLKKFMWPDEIPAMSRHAFTAKYTPYPFNAIDEKVTADDEGFAEVAEATTGFMCIKREVFLRMVDAYPDLHYIPDLPEPATIVNNSYLFFDNFHEPVTKRYMTEDWAFCHRWRAIGGQVFIDLHSKLNHMGPHNWQGDLYANLKLGGVRR